MDDILKMAENKSALASKATGKKKSKYTDEQKIAAVEALAIAKKLNEMLDKTLAKYENK
jgi:hypothetical protein